MKLLVRGLTPIAIIENAGTIVLGPNELLLDFPEEVTLDEMSEEFVSVLKSSGIEGARSYLNTKLYPTTISMWAFRKRFTFDQRVAIETARGENPIVETLMRDLESVKNNMVDLTLEDTINGMGVLVAYGFITQSRADYVLYHGAGDPPEPVDEPETEEPPAEDPPAEDPPAEDPPAEGDGSEEETP